MARRFHLRILFLLAATEAIENYNWVYWPSRAQETLFDPKVTFKPEVEFVHPVSPGRSVKFLSAVLKIRGCKFSDKFHVCFKPNASSQLLEITFERQELFSVLNPQNVNTYQCSLRKNGSVLGWFKQDGNNQIVPFTVIIAHNSCEPIGDLSIRCEIRGTIVESGWIIITSKVFRYEAIRDLLSILCGECHCQVGFYVFLGMVCFVVFLTLVGLAAMIKNNCRLPNVQCCYGCKDEEKQDINNDYGTYYSQDSRWQNTSIEARDQNPEYDAYDYMESNMHNIVKDSNPQYVTN